MTYMTNTRYLHRQLAAIDSAEAQAATYRLMAEAVADCGTGDVVREEVARFDRLADEMEGAAEEWRDELVGLFTIEQIEAATR